jgi:2-polyprenyl-6-methoxyphenol hydroxylase-like FAD-dependent oxidoreductase
MLLAGKKVAIIGAGPVGLTLARLLQQQGVAVTVYERDANAQARIWGGTLDLEEATGQQALQQAGLLAQYFAVAKPMGRVIADERGTELFSTEPNTINPEINRNELRKILLDSLTPGTVVWGRKLTGLEARQGQWVLRFEQQAEVVADVVIGANGGLSSVRPYVTDAEVTATGTFIIQGEVGEPARTCPDVYRLCRGTTHILMIADQGVSLAVNPDNNGTMAYGITFKQPADWLHGPGLDFRDTAAVSDFLGGMFAQWGEEYRQLFRATSVFVGLPARLLSVTLPWKPHRPLPITLVGDAAHLMPPFAGKGVNIGLRDAVVLADNLTTGKFATVAAAIRDYEQQMVGYAQAAQQETSANEAALNHPSFSFKNRFSR